MGVRKKIIIGTLAIVSLFSLTGCMNYTTEEIVVKGKVVEREYEPSTYKTVKVKKPVQKTKTEKVTKTKTVNGKKEKYTVNETKTYTEYVEKNEKKYVPEEYEVDIAYKDMEIEVKSKELYNKVKEGQSIDVVLVNTYDEDGKLINERIRYDENFKANK